MRELLAHFSGPIGVILPLSLLLLKATLKIAVDQQISAAIFVRSIIGVPIDILFLSLSFLSAFIISPAAVNAVLSVGQCMYILLFLIVGCVLAIFLSRRSDRLFDNSRFGWCIVVTMLSYAVSVPALAFSIIVIAG